VLYVGFACVNDQLRLRVASQSFSCQEVRIYHVPTHHCTDRSLFCPLPFRQCRIIELARKSYTRAEMKSAPIVKWTVMMVSVLGEREERPVSGQSCVIGKSIKTFTSNAIHPKISI
jgi:hypothetical protein